MADRIIKSDSGNDVVIQNNAGSRKIEVTNSGDVEVTGDVKTTTVKATNLKANDGTSGLVVADSTGRVTANEKIDLNGNELILDADADTSITADTDDQIDFRAGGTDSVKIGNEHLTINNGNLVIGTGGHGVDFSAQTTSSVLGTTPDTSSGAETLSHYETGTWTPVFGGGTGTLVASVATASYVRIGTLVSLSSNLGVASGVSSPTGDLQISGLPFACASNHDSCGSIYARNLTTNSNMEAGSYISMVLVGSTIYVRLGGRDGADGASTYGSGKIVRQFFADTGVSCWLQITYETS